MCTSLRGEMRSLLAAMRHVIGERCRAEGHGPRLEGDGTAAGKRNILGSIIVTNMPAESINYFFTTYLSYALLHQRHPSRTIDLANCGNDISVAIYLKRSERESDDFNDIPYAVLLRRRRLDVW